MTSTHHPREMPAESGRPSGPRRAPGEPPGERADDEVRAARFAALYQREYLTLVRAADLLVGDWAVAEDIVQGVFAEVFRRWDDLQDRAALGAYLNRAVVYRCRSHHRTNFRRAGRALPPPGSASDPIDTVLRRADAAVLRDALARLSPRQRECVVAGFLLELSETEIATMLGIGVGSVRTHTRRGIEARRKAMQP